MRMLQGGSSINAPAASLEALEVIFREFDHTRQTGFRCDASGEILPFGRGNEARIIGDFGERSFPV